MKLPTPARLVFAMLLLACSGGAAAHPFHPADPGFAAGLLHPFVGLDHLLAMVAVGLWAAQLGGRWVWAIPLAFVSAMLAGGIAGFAGLTLPLLEPVIAASVLAMGLLIVLRIRLHAAGVMLIAAFALFHGMAHAGELPASASALPYAAGFMLATTALHVLGLLAGLRTQAVQWAGIPIALAGCWMVVGTVT